MTSSLDRLNYYRRSKGAQYDFENGCFLNVENALPVTKQDEQESLIRAKRVMGNGESNG